MPRVISSPSRLSRLAVVACVASAAYQIENPVAAGRDALAGAIEVEALLAAGRFRDARTAIDVERARLPDGDPCGSASDALMEAAARTAVSSDAWQEAMALVDSTPQCERTSRVWYARGLAAAKLMRGGERPQLEAVARHAVLRLDTIAEQEGRYGQSEIARLGVLAAVAASQDERDEMHVLLMQAASINDLVPQPEVGLLPIHELAGDLWMEVDRYAHAQAEYLISTRQHPKRARSLVGLARAATKLADLETARAAYAEFLDVWKDADADRPELEEARRAVTLLR